MAPRGRGRGGRGARGGRGRGGGVRRGRVTRHSTHSNNTVADKKAAFDLDTFDVNTADLTALFLRSSVPLEAHMKAQTENKWRYLATFNALHHNGVDVLQVGKIRAVEAAFARRDAEMTELLLSNETDFGVPEVVKALTNMDCKRRARAQQKRLVTMKRTFTTTAGPKGKTRIGRKMNEIKKSIYNYNRDAPAQGTLSGAMARKIKKWTRGLTAEKLDFYALHLPKDTWRQLADVCHLNPDKDFPSAPWFLRHCFAADTDACVAPEGTLTHTCRELTAENVNELVATAQLPFAHIKKYAANLTEESKVKIAKYTPTVDLLIWHYEDLRCAGVDAVIAERLNEGESVALPYGKLMERLLYLRLTRANDNSTEVAVFYPKLLLHAQRMLDGIKLAVESPVVVVGDASASMDVAIQTSTIVASFLTALTHAELVFFSGELIQPKFTPQNVEQVLELAMVTKTVGNTCHAAAIKPYYEQKKVVKTFIICTDEEENGATKLGEERLMFQELFRRYHAEVYPARLVFISFLHSQHSRSQMVTPLTEAGFNVSQFKLDKRRPDLTKLSNLVGQLSTEAQDFGAQINTLEAQLRNEGLQGAFDKLGVVNK